MNAMATHWGVLQQFIKFVSVMADNLIKAFCLKKIHQLHKWWCYDKQ